LVGPQTDTAGELEGGAINRNLGTADWQIAVVNRNPLGRQHRYQHLTLPIATTL